MRTEHIVKKVPKRSAFLPVNGKVIKLWEAVPLVTYELIVNRQVLCRWDIWLN